MRLSSALRTAVACAIVGISTLYGPKGIVIDHIKFPALSYVVLMLFGDTLGDVLRCCADALYAIIVVVPPAMLGRWGLGRSELSLGVAVPVIMVTAFLVTLPGAMSLTAKRVSLLLIVLICVGVDSDNDSDTTFMHVVHVAASAGFGAMASLLAFLLPFPLPALAYCRMKKLSMMYAENACARMKIFGKGFNSMDCKNRSEILMKTKTISETETKLLQSIRILQEEMRWERPWSRLSKHDDDSNMAEKLQRVALAMRGIEYSLMASPVSPLKFEDQALLSSFWTDTSIQFHLKMKQFQQFSPFFSWKKSEVQPLTSLSQLDNHEWACFLFSCADLMFENTPKKYESGPSDQEHAKPGLMHKIKTWFHELIQSGRIKVSIRCALALGLAVLLGELMEQDDGRWAGMTVATSFAAGGEAMLTSTNARGQWTAIGSVFALIGLHIFHQPRTRFLSLLPWVIFVRFLRHSKLYGIPGGYTAGVAALMILGRDNYGLPVDFAIARLTSVFIGLTCILMAEFFTRSERAASLSRRHLYLTMESLKDCIKSLESEEAHHISKLQQLENSIGKLGKYVSDAKSEPDFWYLPFRASCYEKVVASLSNALDMLRFIGHNLQKLRKLKQCLHKEFQAMVHSELDSLEKMVESLLQNLDGSISEPVKKYQPMDMQLCNVMVETGNASKKQRIFTCIGAVEFCIKCCRTELRGIDVLVKEIFRWENRQLHP